MKTSAVKTSGVKRAPSKKSRSGLEDRWTRLHVGDLEPFPDVQRITELADRNPQFAQHVDASGGAGKLCEKLQQAWREYHDGNFLKAVSLGNKLGALGASVANKATAVHVLNTGHGDPKATTMLTEAMDRGNQAVQMLPHYANAHYNLALILGRYSQRISILKALADGLAGKVRTHLEQTLKIEPKHAEAHIAFGLYHAEIIGKLGALAARLTYNASSAEAIAHFQKAIKLVPESPIARIEFGNGLLLLDTRSNREHARRLYAEAAALPPADAMERLDVERAKRGIREP